MKKWAIGCGGALLVVLVVGGIAGYVFVYRPARVYIASFRQLAEVPEIEKLIANKAPFQPPASGELTAEWMTRFVKVQELMQARLGPRFGELKIKYDQMERQQKAEGRQASVTEGLTAIKDLAGIFVEAKRAQVEALNQTAFSLTEYDWVRKQVYAAAGLPLADFNLREIAEAAKSGSGKVDFGRRAETSPEVPERNKEIVKPYAEKLRDWAALGFFGL
jgi:hypothetical protein